MVPAGIRLSLLSATELSSALCACIQISQPCPWRLASSLTLKRSKSFLFFPIQVKYLWCPLNPLCWFVGCTYHDTGSRGGVTRSQNGDVLSPVQPSNGCVRLTDPFYHGYIMIPRGREMIISSFSMQINYGNKNNLQNINHCVLLSNSIRQILWSSYERNEALLTLVWGCLVAWAPACVSARKDWQQKASPLDWVGQPACGTIFRL